MHVTKIKYEIFVCWNEETDYIHIRKAMATQILIYKMNVRYSCEALRMEYVGGLTADWGLCCSFISM